MRSITIVMAVLATFLAICSAETVRFNFQNRCSFPVYIRQAIAAAPGPRPGDKCANFGESGEGILYPGQAFLGQYPIYKDSCGHSVKVARQPHGRVYQFEFTWALENDLVWYNLSHEDGNPFTDVVREFGSVGAHACHTLRCEAGNDGSACDYSIQADCARRGVLAGALCGGAFASKEPMSMEKFEEIWKKGLKWEDLEKAPA